MDEQTSTAPPETGSQPAADDGHRDSTRLNWLEAQGQFSAYEWVQPGDGRSDWEITDIDGEVVGTGPNLRAAIDDAMGNGRGLPCRS